MTKASYRGYSIKIDVHPTSDGHYWASLEVVPPEDRSPTGIVKRDHESHTFPNASEAHQHAMNYAEARVDERIDVPIKDGNR